MPNIPIFLSSDDNYAPFVATTIASICDNTKSFCEFYILDGGISQENQAKICELKKRFNNFEIEFIKIDLEREFKDIEYKNSSKYISISTYNRFLIPKLKPNIDKCIYLDVDIIVFGDIQKMFDEELSNYVIAAVPETYGANPLNETILKISKTHKYFNPGSLIIDCNLWRKNNIASKLWEIEKKYRKVLKFADMDILNICFQNNYKELEAKYCFLNQNYFFSDVSRDIFIRHYNGQIKPWHINFENDVIKDVDIFWNYAKITAFYKELVDKASKIDKNELLRQLRLYKMFNKAQAKKRVECMEVN